MDHSACGRILQNCGDARALSKARLVHSCIVENLSGFHLGIYIGNRLLGAYQKCGSREEAGWIFERMPEKDVVSWNTIILAHSQDGHEEDAFQLFGAMKEHCVEPTRVTFLNILKACSNLAQGEHVFAQIKDNGLESDLVVGNALISMFRKCGSLDMAAKVFLIMKHRDTVTWTTMILTYINCGKAVQALELFQQMKFEGEIPTVMTYAVILNGVAHPTMLNEGRSIHFFLVIKGCESSEMLGCALLAMYGKCAMIDDACQIFGAISKLNVVTWNCMISMLIKQGCSARGLGLYCQMHHLGICPNSVTFISTLDACANITALKEGMLIHITILDMRIESNAVWNALFNMYGTCRRPWDAISVFKRLQKKDVVSWSSMIQVFGQTNQVDKVFQAFHKMQLEGVQPNMFTFLNVVKVCIDHSILIDGLLVHTLIVEEHFELDLRICNALITMHGICGSARDAHYVFSLLPTRDDVSWTAIIAAHAHNGNSNEALTLLLEMLSAGIFPTDITYVSIIDALNSFTAVEEGRIVHFLCCESGKDCSLILGNAFMSFYAKCGELDEVSCLFRTMVDRDVVSWSTFITACSNGGNVKDAYSLVMKMKEKDLHPDAIMFVQLLSACSHGGLVVEGLFFFHFMLVICEMLPREEHFRCIIDLLSRVGWLQQVEFLINKFPYPPAFAAWMTLLSACRVHNDITTGKRSAEHLLELDSSDPACCVLLSNFYVTTGMQFEVDRIWKHMKGIDGNNRIHVGDLCITGLKDFNFLAEE